MLELSFLSQERNPVPPGILKAGVILSGAVPLLLALRSETPPSALNFSVAALAAVLAFAGWNMRTALKTREAHSSVWMLLLAVGALIAGAGLVVQQVHNFTNVLWVALLPILVILRYSVPIESRVLIHFITPLTFGSIFMFTSGALGLPAIGAFPAIIGALFVAVVRATLDIEQDIFENHAETKHFEVDLHYRRRLAITAVIFFLFGTVSLWPWLGDMYGKSYFWLLLVGVLLPLAFFWGRIRQPKLEGAKTALIRFNRVAPILGLIHVLAFMVS